MKTSNKVKYRYGDQLARIEGILTYQRAVQEILDDAKSYEVRRGTTKSEISEDLNLVERHVQESLDSIFKLYDILRLETEIEDRDDSPPSGEESGNFLDATEFLDLDDEK